MTEFCEIHLDDWEAYVRGGLDADMREEMSAHLRGGCERCAKRFEDTRAAEGLVRVEDGESEPAGEFVVPYSAKPRWSFWNVAPWITAAVFFGLFVIAERAHLNLQKQMLDARQMNPMTNHLVRESQAQARPAGSEPNSENDRDLQATIEQLRVSLDQSNQQIAQAQRDAARFQTDLKAAQIQVAALDGSVRDAEDRRVKAEADAASMRLQLDKAQSDARRAATLSAQNQQMMKLLESPQLHQFTLATVGAAGDANARVVWDYDRGLMLIAHNLPDLAENHVYQLWLLPKGQASMVSAGVIQVDSRGRGTVYVAPGDNLNNFGAVAVTDEPSAGSNAPRGNQILFGK